MQHLVAPSILSADFAHLGEAVEMIDRSEADWVHVDVMDGRFVPNLTFGFPVMKAVRKLTQKPFDVHLMIEEPEKHVAAFRDAGADHLTVHLEVSPHLHRTVQSIKEAGMKAGVAINPHSPVMLLEDIIRDIDIILLMSVNPGFGGQNFIEHSFRKLSELVALKQRTGSEVLIEIDGGVSTKNAAALVEAGVNVLVAGSAVFKADNPAEAIHALKHPSGNTIEI